jgi:AcrR family transcriptional regulator
MSPQSTKEQLFQSACRVFADCGYAGASVEDIVKKAGTTKPSLYYYYGNKENLFRSLVHFSHDERFRIMKEVCKKHRDLRDRLIGILDGFFEFAQEHSDLTRICFNTAFAAEKEIPFRNECFKKAERNFEFCHSIIKQGMKDGFLSKQYDSRLLTSNFYAKILFYTISYILKRDPIADHRRSCAIVDLFFTGAGTSKSRKRKA